MAGPTYAALDLGTNTFRLPIAEFDNSCPAGMRILYADRVITRAGGGYQESVGFHADAVARIVTCVRHFGEKIREFKVERTMAVATSVFRRAKNRADVVAAIQASSGIQAEIIDGVEEAGLSAAGALSQIDAKGPAVVFDIGGGSTEFIVCVDGKVVKRRSFEFGVVRLSEDVLQSDPLKPEEIARMEAAVAPAVLEAAKDAVDALGRTPFTLVGTAGTVSTLGAIDLGLSVYDRERLNGHRLQRDFIAQNYVRFRDLSRAGRLAVAGMEAGREDLIVPGTYIALRTMDAFQQPELVISEGGLLEGVMFKLMRAAAPVTAHSF